VNPKLEEEKEEDCDECGYKICTFTYLYVNKNPWDPSEVSIELYDDEDYPRANAISFKLSDLGVKSAEELLSKLENDNKFFLNVISKFNKDAVEGDDFDCNTLIDSATVFSMCDDKDYNEYKIGKRVLKIEKFNDGFRFGVKGDKCGISWLVRQHPKDPNKVVIFFEKDEKPFGFVVRDYDFFEVKRKTPNLCALYKYLVEDPQEATWFITWEDLEIDDIEVVNKSGYDGFDFEVCKCEGCEEKKEEEESEEERERKEKEKELNELLSQMPNTGVKAFDVRANKEIELNELPKTFTEVESGVTISLGNDQPVETPVLRFNKVAEIVNNNNSLLIFDVPRINEKLEFTKVSEFQFCGFETRFIDEVVQFKVNVEGGVTFLVFNQHDITVNAEIKYAKNKTKYVSLKPKKLYLFVYRCPKWELELMKIFGPTQEYLNKLNEYVENIHNVNNIEGLCRAILRLFGDANALSGSGKTYETRLKIQDIISLYSMKVIQLVLKTINNQAVVQQGLRLDANGFPRSWQGRVCKVIVELSDYLMRGERREDVVKTLLKALLVYLDVMSAVFKIMNYANVNRKEVEEKVRNVEMMAQKVLAGERVEVTDEDEDAENVIKQVDEKCRHLNDLFKINIEGMTNERPSADMFGSVVGIILLGESLEIFRSSIQAMLGEFSNINLNLKDTTNVKLERKNGIFSEALEKIDKIVRLVILDKANKKEYTDLLSRSLIYYYEILQTIATGKAGDIGKVKKELSDIDVRLNELEKRT